MRPGLTPQRFLLVLGFWLVLAGGVFALCMFVSGRVGSVGIEWGLPADAFALEFRMQRVVAAAMVGFALAASGVALQALLRNPLADPYVLGISSGSTVGVMVWLLAGRTILLGWFSSAAPLLLSMGRTVPAVVGAVVTCMLVFALSRNRSGGMQPVTLLLVGVVISSVNAAVLMVLNSLAPQGVLSNFALFMLGSISEGQLTRSLLIVAGVVLLAGYLPTLLSAAALNIGTFSDAEAASLGVNIQRLRTVSFVCASVMTGAAILLSGPIGFVGLICPHICRRLKMLGGADHRTLLVAAPLCGAAFLMLADTAVRVAATLNKGTFPVGVVTALCGGPFFLFLLRRQKI